MPEKVSPTGDRADSGIVLWAVDLAGGAAELAAFGHRLGFATAAGSSGAPDPARTAARIALRLILAGYLGAEAACRPFVLSRTGKPSLAASVSGSVPALHFNLAHCETAALVAISRKGPVGVDIEAERNPQISDHRRTKLIEAARAVAPLDALPKEPAQARFLQAWVRLEALAKASGEGLGALFGRLDEVSRAPDTAAVDGARVVVRDVLLGGHRLWAAVAGASTALTSGPPPAVTWLPLDDVWLEHWVNWVPGGRPPAPVALTQS